MENLIISKIYSNKQISPMYMSVILEYLSTIKYMFKEWIIMNKCVTFSLNSCSLVSVIPSSINRDTILQRLKYQCDIQFYSIAKILCRIFTLHCNTIKNNSFNNKSIVQYSCKKYVQIRDNKFSLIFGKSYFCEFNSYHILYLYWCYFVLLNENRFLECLDVNMLQKLNSIERNVQTMYVNCNKKVFCKTCLDSSKNIEILKRENINFSKKYYALQSEKEKLVMKYATSEKSLIESRRCIKIIEKKHYDMIKENSILQKRIQKVESDSLKLSKEIKYKNTEVSELQNELEYLKCNNKNKKCLQNKSSTSSDDHKEKQTNLNHLKILTHLQHECTPLKLKVDGKVENLLELENIVEQSSCLCTKDSINMSEESIRIKIQHNSSTSLEMGENRVTCIHTFQVRNLQKELENEKKTIQSLNERLSEYEALNIESKCNEQRIILMGIELNRLSTEKIEFQEDIQFFRKRENEMLDFIQKVTDKNIQLQCEVTNMKSKLRDLENSHMLLHQNIRNFMNEIKNLEYYISTENVKRRNEIKLLTNCVAEQIFYNQRLLMHLEDVVGDNTILRKRYILIIREITRELQNYHINFGNIKYQIPTTSKNQ